MKNKGGRLPKNQRHLLEVRKEFIRQLLEKEFTKAEVAIIFNIHPAQITRYGKN